MTHTPKKHPVPAIVLIAALLFAIILSASFLIRVASARIPEDSSTSTFVASFKFIVAIRRLSPRRFTAYKIVFMISRPVTGRLSSVRQRRLSAAPPPYWFFRSLPPSALQRDPSEQQAPR